MLHSSAMAMPRGLLHAFSASAARKAAKRKLAVPPHSPSPPPPSGQRAASKPAKSPPGISSQILSRLRKASTSNSEAPLPPGPAEDPTLEIPKVISSILLGNNEESSPSHSQESHDRAQLKTILDIPWLSNVSSTRATELRKEMSRERKKKYIFKNTESRRFTRLMKLCADKMGTESTLEFFSKLGRETGVKEYNTLVELCIEKARSCSDEDDSLVHVHRAYQIFLSMRERGFQIEEESYGPFLLFLIDVKMTEEFQTISKFFKGENPQSFSRIGYYEMLLWIRVGDEDKIQELCHSVGGSSSDSYNLAESYLLAFCESDRQELLPLLEVLDITKVSKEKHVTSIFKSLGRLKLEKLAEKFLLELKATGIGDETFSFFIYDYATSIPNLVADDIVSKFTTLHEKFEVIPSIASCDKLITLFCNSAKVDVALNIVDHMCESGLNVPMEVFHHMIHACEKSFHFEMVHPIYSMMRRHNLKPKEDTFRSMISLCVKMKDFEGAYKMLTDAEEIGEGPNVSMYNAIMTGYFKEKNVHGALMVLDQMQKANAKLDSETFSYLISNCESEEDIAKYRDELCQAGIRVTKHVYMALIHAYAKFGNIEMAKQVVLDSEIPANHLTEIKNALLVALSSNGEVPDALKLYDEMNQAGCALTPKALISLIEHIQTEGELYRLCQLLKELNDTSSWAEGCSRVTLYCVRYSHTNAATSLLKQLKEKDSASMYMVIDKMFSQIWNAEPVNMEIGMQLLRAVKEELGCDLSRTSLDFLLSSCVKAKDYHSAQLIWSEYKSAGLPYNVLSLLRMYQALLASGECKLAKVMLERIPKDDPHVRYILKSSKSKYSPKPLTLEEQQQAADHL